MKAEDNFEQIKCNLCNSNEPHILFKGKDMVHKKQGTFTVVQCKKCGLIYTNPRPKQSIISEYYPDDYWDIDEATKSSEAKLKLFIHKFINKFSYKLTIAPQIDGKILDIGCGDGKLLFKLKKDGWRTYGVETSELAAEYAQNKYDIEIFNGTVEEAQFEDETFDVVILNHVLEHLSDPTATLNEINRIMAEGGILAVGIPNAGSFEAKFFKKYWTAWELPRHLYHFTPETASSLLEKTGFEEQIIKFDNNPNIILSSFKYVFQDLRINPLIGLTLIFPFAVLTSFILSRTKRSYNMFLYSKKRTREL